MADENMSSKESSEIVERLEVLEKKYLEFITDKKINDAQMAKIAETVDKIYEILSGGLNGNGALNDIKEHTKALVELKAENKTKEAEIKALKADLDELLTDKKVQKKVLYILVPVLTAIWSGLIALVKFGFTILFKGGA
jgi:hypothetical protein